MGKCPLSSLRLSPSLLCWCFNNRKKAICLGPLTIKTAPGWQWTGDMRTFPNQWKTCSCWETDHYLSLFHTWTLWSLPLKVSLDLQVRSKAGRVWKSARRSFTPEDGLSELSRRGQLTGREAPLLSLPASPQLSKWSSACQWTTSILYFVQKLAWSAAGKDYYRENVNWSLQLLGPRPTNCRAGKPTFSN